MIDLVYFGTSTHSVILLEKIKNSPELSLNLVITKADKPVGRHQVLKASAVKEWCIKNTIPYFTSNSIKADSEKLNTELEKLKDKENLIGLVADFGLIIPEKIINFFKKGLINIHFSLLPKYRGASPVTYTILNGDTSTGITFLYTTKEMDKGDILKQIPYEIKENENDESLYIKLFNLAGNNILNTLEEVLSKKLFPIPQDESQASYTTPTGKFDRTTYILKNDAEINWNMTDPEIERTIRAYNPWPVAYSTLLNLTKSRNLKLKSKEHENLKIKIHKAHLNEDNKLIIDEVQLENKSKTDYKSFENGYLDLN